MSLAIFDLDNTLIAGDSDYLWGQYLTETGAVDKDWYESENQRFYDEYKAGTLDIYEFLRFSLKPLSEHSLVQLRQWHSEFMQKKIDPIWLPAADELVNRHRDAGDTLLIITATNSFVTEPIAQRLGVDNLLATEPEIINNHYTGNVTGIPCFKDGKVTRLNEWLQQNDVTLADSTFYSDSHNDLPLLSLVDHPVAVDPDDTLLQHAEMKGWKIISLH